MSLMFGYNLRCPETEMRKRYTEFIDPNSVQSQTQQQISKSTTSSFIASLVDQSNGVGSEAYHQYVRGSSPEVETMLDRFISSYNDTESDNPTMKREELENSESLVRSKMSLVRQTSSPAGFFTNFSPDNNSNNANGFATTMRGGRRFDKRCGFDFYTPEIGECRNENVELRNPESGVYLDDSENRSDGMKMFLTSTSLQTQNIEFGGWTGGLTHHSSLPSNFSIGGTDRVLQFQSSVPCNMRAKRGYATHPRSIAERNRRKRITERIEKLQDLFPNLDKQANTSDKLELVVERIKDLQRQIKILKDRKAKCLC